MLKRFTAFIMALCFIIPGCITCFAKEAPEAEEAYCLHENAEWKLLFPQTLFSERYYVRKCPDCGFKQTAMESRTSLPELFFDILSRAAFFFEQPKVYKNFKVTGHTGSPGTTANTIPSLRYSLQSGAEMVEFDLNYNSNGVAVLAHDDPDSSQTTLEEAFALVAKYVDVQVNVDIKNKYAVEQVQELAIKYGILDRIFYTGLFEYDVDYVKEHSPLVSYFLNAASSPNTEECARLCDKAVKLGAMGLNFGYRDLSEEIVAAAHERGLLISVYTVNDLKDMRECLKYDVDYITTEYPYKLYTITSKFVKNFRK